MTERDAVDQRSTPVAVIGHLRRRFFFFLPPSANRSAIPLRMYTANKSVMCQLPLRVRVATGFDRKCAGCDRFRPDESHGSVPIDAQVTVCRRSMRELKSAAAAISTNPVNVLDPIRKRFGYGQSRPVVAVTASAQPESARIVHMPDPTSRIRFSSVFPKKAWLTVCKTDPDPIWMAWSGSGQTQLFWKQAGVQESAGPVSGRTQPAPLPVSHFQTRFRSSTDVPDNICAKPTRVRFSSG